MVKTIRRTRVCLRQCKPITRSQIVRRLDGTRSPFVTIADTEPKNRWCDDRCRLIPEVLHLEGYEPRGESVVLIDGGRETIRNVVGSIRNIKVRGAEVVGSIHWARDKRSQDVKAKWLDNHLDLFESEIQSKLIHEYGIDDKFQGQRGPVDHVVRWTITAVRIMAAHGDR